jgi:uncharacterized protein (TIGR04255 family)
MARVPVRLQHPPLVEVVFEVRFASTIGSTGDLLPGLIYPRVGKRFPKLEKLPLADFPKEMREADVNLKYVPHLRLSGQSEALLLGDHVFTVSKMPPYHGWPHFHALCEESLQAFKDTSQVERVERLSLKCVNILETGQGSPLSLLSIELKLGEFSVTDRGFRLRNEFDLHGFTNIVEIVGQATAEVQGKSRSGLLFSLDTIKQADGGDVWNTALSTLDDAHVTLKNIFFGLLAPATLEALGPLWEG